MHVKVQGGTVQHGDASLCTTCCHSTIIRGKTLAERIVACSASIMHSRMIFNNSLNGERLMMGEGAKITNSKGR